MGGGVIAMVLERKRRLPKPEKRSGNRVNLSARSRICPTGHGVRALRFTAKKTKPRSDRGEKMPGEARNIQIAFGGIQIALQISKGHIQIAVR